MCNSITNCNIVVLVSSKSVPLTLSKTQAHAGEEQEEEKSLELHGCCSCCVAHCAGTNWLIQKAEQHRKLKEGCLWLPLCYEDFGCWCNSFHHKCLRLSSCERKRPCVWPLIKNAQILAGFQLCAAVSSLSCECFSFSFFFTVTNWVCVKLWLDSLSDILLISILGRHSNVFARSALQNHAQQHEGIVS